MKTARHILIVSGLLATGALFASAQYYPYQNTQYQTYPYQSNYVVSSYVPSTYTNCYYTQSYPATYYGDCSGVFINPHQSTGYMYPYNQYSQYYNQGSYIGNYGYNNTNTSQYYSQNYTPYNQQPTITYPQPYAAGQYPNRVYYPYPTTYYTQSSSGSGLCYYANYRYTCQ